MRKLFFIDENCNSDKPSKDASIPTVIIVVISEKFILSLIMGYRTLEFIIFNFEKRYEGSVKLISNVVVMMICKHLNPSFDVL